MNYFEENGVASKPMEVPIWRKSNLTIKEAAMYSNIGEHTLKELCESGNSCFSFLVGKKRLINLAEMVFKEWLRIITKERLFSNLVTTCILCYNISAYVIPAFN